jgi:DNA invertase Pin-like site-specific DNA recombinase
LKTILYARVSTAEQDASHQRTQAEQAGFKIDEVVSDEGVSGVTVPLAERPQGRRLFDMLRSGDTLVVRWVDRLGRNYADVTDSIRTLMRMGVIVRTVISNMTFDGATKDPVQMAVRDALIAFMAATAQAQAEATKAAQRAGIDAERNREGQRSYLGRKPSFTRDQLRAAQDALALGTSPASIARDVGISRQTVYRIKADAAACEAALAAWGDVA